MYPSADRFGIFTLLVFMLHYWGEILTVACLGMFMNPNLANSVAALLQSAAVIIASGYVRYEVHREDVTIVFEVGPT